MPATCWFLTNRCFQTRFLLRPDPALNNLVGYWLARAAEATGVRVHAVALMSNHFHLQVTDVRGELADFMCRFQTNVAKGVNELRGRENTVFPRRYSGEPILDAGGLLKCIAYLILNPVKAGLVARPSQWPGLLLWARPGAPNRHTFSRFDRRAWEQACAAARDRGDKSPSRAQFTDYRTLTLHPLPGAPGDTPPAQELAADGEATPAGAPAQTVSADLPGDPDLAPGEAAPAGAPAQTVSADLPGDPDLAPEAVERRVRELRQEIERERLAQHKEFLGARAVCRQDPESAPANPKRSSRPLCHAASATIRGQFRRQWRAFTDAFRQAAARLRAGETDVAFPLWSFPPGRPLCRGPT